MLWCYTYFCLIYLNACWLSINIATATSASQMCTFSPCVGPLEYVFCRGKLLHTAWTYGFESFLNHRLKYDPEEVLANFAKLPSNESDWNSTMVKAFFSENFENTTSTELSFPADWVPFPLSLRSISDNRYRQFAWRINNRWRNLTYRVKFDVEDNPNRYSLIPVPNKFVVPGGHFDSYFYWDSFWILKGLHFSGMTITARGILDNFKHLVENLGYIPNSGRVYIARRSQPPFFIQMAADYYKERNDRDWLISMLPSLQSEYNFWIQNRSITVNSHRMFQYRAIEDCPRPEMYLNDLADAQKSSYNSSFLYSSIASACESGWDFSSRWFDWTGANKMTKAQTKTLDIIPVDLNAFMCKNMQILAHFYQQIGSFDKATYFRSEAQKLKNAINEVLWSENDGIWYDYDLSQKTFRAKFYPSNFFPLLCFTAKEIENLKIANKITRYWTGLNFLSAAYPGGVPTSLSETGQQWDFPNAWPPLIHLLIESLDSSGVAKLQDDAFAIASRWVRTNYIGFVRSHGGMWEKYNVSNPKGRPGGGGEYQVEEGFGWTNGVVLDLLRKYGGRLVAPTDHDIGKLGPNDVGLNRRFTQGSDLRGKRIDEIRTLSYSATFEVAAISVIAVCISLSCVFAHTAMKRRYVKDSKSRVYSGRLTVKNGFNPGDNSSRVALLLDASDEESVEL